MTGHRLLLLRHAKSRWDLPLTDRDRPLGPRGMQDAQLLGDWIAARALPPPDRILASPAVRVRETLARLLPRAGWSTVEVAWDETLYLAPAERLWLLVHRLQDAHTRVLLAGHNPGLETLLLELVTGPVPTTPKGKSFTTANLASLQGPRAWRHWAPGCARLEFLVRPRSLRGASS